MQFNVNAFKASVAKATQGVTKEAMETDNAPSPKGKYINDPGEYEVTLEGIKEVTMGAAQYEVIPFKTSDDKEGSLFKNFKNKEGEVNYSDVYMALNMFNVQIPLAVLRPIGQETLLPFMSSLMTGKFIIKAEYFGPYVKYVEKGVYHIVDKTGKEVPNPGAQECVPHGSFQEAKAAAEAPTSKGGYGLKVSRLSFSVVGPAKDYTMDEGVKACLKYLVERREELAAEKAGTPVEEEAPAKPSWLK